MTNIIFSSNTDTRIYLSFSIKTNLEISKIISINTTTIEPVK